MHKPVNSKRDFVRRYARGEFGNCSPTWNIIEDWLESDYQGLMHIRNRVKGGITCYNVRRSKMLEKYKVLRNMGIPRSSLYFSAMCPTKKTVFQGEIQQSTNHYDLTWTDVAKPMRDALATKQYNTNGLQALQLLKRFMCSNSYEWLTLLLREYTGHVVEFTTFSTNWGTLPNYNTVFWEVRNY